ncbi:type II toxin-antitoxin system Phd/YefM family antitoxin [Pseudomonas anguilliseptica]|uniref:type II toxin-antitoxin system Phd/YefM family antitoxin n=1 Tax=Pseudomonas anguilliseptica TaxID=53406 RepID=UPI002278FA25|nr:type II toxin-antitoxin system Phd/YefM family antitoxin [Pseudomonas anguilliseptica]
MQTLTASEARANFYRLMDQCAESHKPIMIVGKRSHSVLLSAEDWGAIQETLCRQADSGNIDTSSTPANPGKQKAPKSC